MKPPKDKTFNLRMDAQDRKRLDALAEYHAAPAATTVRMLVKHEYDRLINLGLMRKKRL